MKNERLLHLCANHFLGILCQVKRMPYEHATSIHPSALLSITWYQQPNDLLDLKTFGTGMLYKSFRTDASFVKSSIVKGILY